MKLNIPYRNLAGVVIAATILGTGNVVSAAPITGSTPVNGSSATKAEAQHLQRLQTRANAEIGRRLGKLNKLNALIDGSKLSSSDKAALSKKVNGTVSGLSALRSKIDADTDLTGALIDVKSLTTEYQVYMFVTPKVHILTTADTQRRVETKLATLISKLQTRIADARREGQDVTTLQSALGNMSQKVAAAKSISASVEAKVLPLKPSSYDGEHATLNGYRNQLVTAHDDNKVAYQEAKIIVQGLQNR